MNREAFLCRITKQLGRQAIPTPPDRESIGAPDHWQSFHLSKSKRIDRFCQEARALGAEVVQVKTQEQLQKALQSLLTSLNPKSILLWDQTIFQGWEISSVLDQWKQFFVNPLENQSEALHADIGITTVDFAIADTGTLVLCTHPLKSRGVSLFPIHHIAIVDASQIRTRMGEVLAELKVLKAPSSVHFISGPSRSSDIENDLSIGVHGPAALHILLKI